MMDEERAEYLAGQFKGIKEPDRLVLEKAILYLEIVDSMDGGMNILTGEDSGWYDPTEEGMNWYLKEFRGHPAWKIGLSTTIRNLRAMLVELGDDE
tara:strand:- start:656 stop:943 length:288 start_codon:yes stop_codon:yes gene_type:complete